MDMSVFMQTGIFNWLIMPIVIVIARIFDVSLSTIRVYLTSRGEKKFAAAVGFFEVLIWLIVVRQIITTIENPLWFVAYATGFALGTYIGISISERLSVGRVIFRIISSQDTTTFLEVLTKEGIGFTVVDAKGREQKSQIIFSVIRTKDIPHIIKLLNKYQPRAFYTIEDVKKVNKGQFKESDSFFLPVENMFKFRLGK